WRKGSVHIQPWPESAPLREAAGGEEPALLDSVSQAAISVRRIKSDAKVSPRTALLSVAGRAPQAALPPLEAAISARPPLGRIESIELAAGPDGEVTAEGAELGEPPAKRARS